MGHSCVSRVWIWDDKLGCAVGERDLEWGELKREMNLQIV